MRCLIIPLPDVSSLNIIMRCMSLTAELIKHGDEVAVLSPDILLKRYDHINFKKYHYELMPEIDNVDETIPPIQSFGDYADLIGLNKHEYITNCIDNELKAIKNFKPDVIYSDIALTASISARITKIPIASLANFPWQPPYFTDDQFKINKKQVQPFNDILQHYGLQQILDISDLIFMYSDLKIVPGCKEFDEFDNSIKNIEYVGSLYSSELENEFNNFDIPLKMKNILVYMGVGDIDIELLKEVMPSTFDNTEYNVMIVVGDYVDELPEATKNVTYYRLLPLEKVMKHTDLLIYHGGSGLVLSSLIYGVPGIAFPCGVYERVHNAETMAKVNAGIVKYDISDFNKEVLLESIDFMNKNNYKENAVKFGNYLKSLGGPKRAVELLSQLSKK